MMESESSDKDTSVRSAKVNGSHKIESLKIKPGQVQVQPGQASTALMPNAKESVILKILIIGDPCVGKTSYVQRYVNGMFHRNYKGTIGVDFALKIIRWGDDGTVKIQLWDIAGQERYTSMTRVYYRDAHGCCVMFDLSNRNSFLNVVKWKRDFDSKCVTQSGDPIPCLLIANKSDVGQNKQVTNEEIERMCIEFNFSGWAETSVKDNIMVDDSMKFMVSCILNQESVDQKRPGMYDQAGTFQLTHNASYSSSRGQGMEGVGSKKGCCGK